MHSHSLLAKRLFVNGYNLLLAKINKGWLLILADGAQGGGEGEVGQANNCVIFDCIPQIPPL